MSDLSAKVAVELAKWYGTNKRDLPWRHTLDPYQIWISEVILQQTRVIQGLPYYYKFIELFPKVQDLANADEQEVLRCWQGLGYYSRARNMHFTAKMVVENFEGIFPSSFSTLITLKGIGPYTAAAVASFASNEDVAVLDGNVMRVLCRLFNIEKDIAEEKTRKELQLLANNLLPKGNAAIHNQAMMELGALVCIPKNPKCEICPVNDYCISLAQHRVKILPLKSKKVKVKTRYFNYLVIVDEEMQYLMKKRGKTDIWEGLWDFHLIETQFAAESPSDLKLSDELISNFTFIKSSAKLKHQLTHQTIWTKFWVFEVKKHLNSFIEENNLIVLGKEAIFEVPKPVLINKFLNNYLFL